MRAKLLVLCFVFFVLFSVISFSQVIISDGVGDGGVEPVNQKFSKDGNARIKIESSFPKITSSSGLSDTLSYSFEKLSDTTFKVIYCHKDYDKNFAKAGFLDKIAYDSISISAYKNTPTNFLTSISASENKCGSFNFEGSAGDAIKIGSESTIIEVMNNNLTAMVSPEFQTCNGLDCESNIIETNNGDTFVITNLSQHISVSFIKKQNITDLTEVCDEQNCSAIPNGSHIETTDQILK